MPSPSVSDLNKKEIIYHSVEDKTKELAEAYAETKHFSHRYLAYRDLPCLLKSYVKGSLALDFGTGTGISASFLHELGFSVCGIDNAILMLENAKKDFPYIPFYQTSELAQNHQFDLIFSSFVLFDMRSKHEIITYLNQGALFLKKGGIFIIITGSEELYSITRKWTAFETNFPENLDLRSGQVAKLRLKDPTIEFLDYFWTEDDYLDCFEKANFTLLEIHRPKGLSSDPFTWLDEVDYAPFTIYILENQN